MKLTSFLALGLLTLLTACVDGVSKNKLDGDRIEINFKRSALTANPAALNTGLRLPRAENSSQWAQTGGNASHSLLHVALSENMKESWAESLGGGNTRDRRIFSAPVYENGAIFASNTYGEIFAISEEYGEVLWEVEKEGEDGEKLDYAPGLAVKDGLVYATLSNGDVLALDAETGTEKWKATLGLPLRSAPSVDDKHVYVIAHNNSFYALDLKTGTLKWTHNGIEEQLAILGGPSAVISKGVVVVPYSSGEIYALSQKDGRYLWHDALSVNVGSDLYSSLVDVEASPVIADDIVYAVNHNGQLSAFDLKNGRRYWSIALSATQMPWVSGSALYVVTENDEIVCVNRRDGLIRWVKNINAFVDEDDRDENIYWAGPVLAGDRLVVTSSIGTVVMLDPYEGELKSSFNVDESVTIAPIVAAKRLVLFSDNARLMTFK
ncbi:MAG: outer membrane protein assembly factor BamB [bacterium]|jgi:outer membrane protein assembly factor BamB